MNEREMSQRSHRRDLMWLLVAALACSAVVVLCYLFVDRQIVWMAHGAEWRSVRVLHWVQKIPHGALWTVPGIAIWLTTRRLQGLWSRLDHVLFQVGSSLILTVILKGPVKVLFGRYWPSTFRDGNPSLIGDGAYGFHPLSSGFAYDSFPSGHTAAIVAAATVIWVSYPRWRWLAATLVALSSAGVVGLYYHFVSDVVAGAFFGWVVGNLVVRVLPQPGETQDPRCSPGGPT